MTGAFCTKPVKTNRSRSRDRRFVNKNTENYDCRYHSSYSDVNDDESDECDRSDLIKSGPGEREPINEFQVHLQGGLGADTDCTVKPREKSQQRCQDRKMPEIGKLKEQSKNLPRYHNHVDINCSESDSEDEFLDLNGKRGRQKFLEKHTEDKNILKITNF